MLQNGTYTFRFDSPPQVDVEAVLLRRSKLDVFVYVDKVFSFPIIRHFLELRENEVKVVDIYGAAPGSQWHRKGLGALAVNTAIQFLKALYPPSATMRGHVFCAKDFDLPEPDRLKRQADRKAFWRTFGYDIVQPDACGDEHFCGTVGELRVAATGQAAGVHPRAFDISRMHFYAVDEKHPNLSTLLAPAAGSLKR